MASTTQFIVARVFSTVENCHSVTTA